MDISSALKNTILGSSTVVAGHGGLSKPIVWAHIVDHPDIVDWVQPGHLLLMTGYHWPTDDDKQKQLIHSLSNKGLSGIVLAIPRFLSHFPEAAIQAANQTNLPLLELPWDIPFSQVTEAIHSRIIQHQNEILTRSDTIHRALTRAAASLGSLSGLTNIISDELGRDAAVFSNEGVLLGANNLSAKRQDYELSFFRRWREQEGTALRSDGSAFLANISGSLANTTPTRLGCAIHTHSGQRGLIWLEHHNNSFSDLDRRAIEHAAIVAALHFSHLDVLEQSEEQSGYVLLESLLDGSFANNPVSYERARLMGWDPFAFYRVALINIQNDTNLPHESIEHLNGIKRLLYRLLDSFNAPKLIFSTTEYIYFLIPNDINLDRFSQRLSLGKNMSMILSRPVQGSEGVAFGGEDVRCLVDEQQWGKVVTFESTLFPRTLMGDADARKMFIDQQLGVLFAEDKNNILLQTLKALCNEGFHLNDTATALNVHINTLRKRIEKIQVVLGQDLNNASSRFELQIAIVLHEMTTSIK